MNIEWWPFLSGVVRNFREFKLSFCYANSATNSNATIQCFAFAIQLKHKIRMEQCQDTIVLFGFKGMVRTKKAFFHILSYDIAEDITELYYVNVNDSAAITRAYEPFS